jgi:predicted CoA-binding protein
MSDLFALATEPDTSYAVVGATDRPGKYGGIIYRDLKGKGFQVFAVNPYRDEVDGDPCWPSVLDLPEKPTMAVLVVPAKRGLGVLKDCAEAGVDRIWVQPGASSPDLVDALEDGDFDYVVEQCVMVRTRGISV